ncbi:hypothetical protein Sulba_1201 [Sulfurospirillum barnesii SES-3]|uniref:Uncharacterized protein n=2 Tax=Sulfurospirillum barnesii TaxID=44674 RepID=I3XX21_SULBS|nr:hypothetical protein Sulba_1201 [Sulfurospirillum barnesii SES-3]
MKKEILYLTEYLAKSKENPFYPRLVENLSECSLYTPTHFTQAHICALLKHHSLRVPSNEEEGIQQLDMCLQKSLPEALNEAKKTLFMTLLQSNFPKKKSFLNVSLELFISQLEPAEKSIYENLLAYVVGINRALALFFVFAKEEQKELTPEHLVTFAQSLHVSLMALIFNDDEQALLEEGLTSLLGVYLSLYGKYLYM